MELRSFFNKKTNTKSDKLSSMNEENKNNPATEENIEQDGYQQELPAEPINESEKRVAELEEQVAQLNDKYLRLYSGFDNFRRRTAKERI